MYLCFIPVLTFHEFAHAWTSSKCGDDTAKDLGRVSLNPLVHMELIGTVLLPLLAIYLSLTQSVLAGLIIGWGKPVPVDLNNLRNPRRDDTLIALAGPGMNFVLAFISMGVLKIGSILKGQGMDGTGELLYQMGDLFVVVNLLLAFFNLLPIPPLDGSHVLWNALRLSWESYFRAMQFGLILVIVALQIPATRQFLGVAVGTTRLFLARIYGI
jgi:Zn-dependent protease